MTASLVRKQPSAPDLVTFGLGKVRTTQWQCQYNPLDTLCTQTMRPLGSGSWRMASYQFICLRPAGHTSIDEQSVCQTICDWNTSCAAYEWGAGCYLSSEWGFEAINLRFTEGGRAGADALVLSLIHI